LVNLEEIIALHHLTSFNAQKAHHYIQCTGSVAAAIAALKKGTSDDDNWKKDLDLAQEHGVTLISYFDANYPLSLKNLADPPLLLYVKGEMKTDAIHLAMVGTRQSSSYGLDIAEKWGCELSHRGLTIVSGLARGIDAASHLGALERGRTLAILGSGLNQIYPRENQALARAISCQGSLISEYPMNSHPEKHFFPKRNRLVSALSEGVLLIEAPIKSGAMITMDLAFSQKKICCALPGPVDRDSFRGNHSLIKSQKAHLVENPQDVVSLLKPGISSASISLKKESPFILDPEEENLIKQLPQGEICLEEIALRVHLPMAKLNSLLMKLVLKQVVKEYPGKFYKKVYKS
jgi:DNA processing protein